MRTWFRLVCILLIFLMGHAGLPASDARAASEDLLCSASVDAGCGGGITEDKETFDFLALDFHEAIARFPDFLSLPNDFLPDLDRMQIPVFLQKQQRLLRCEEELARSLDPTCHPGQIILVSMFFFGAGLPSLAAVPTPDPSGDPKNSWQRLKRLAKEHWKSLFMISGTATAFYVKCIATDEETACQRIAHDLLLGAPPHSRIWQWVQELYNEGRLGLRATSISRQGGHAVWVKAGSTAARVYTPGKRQTDGSFEAQNNKILMDAPAHYNQAEGRMYVPLRFMAEAIGARVSSPQGECDSQGRNCRLIPTFEINGLLVEFPVDRPYYRYALEAAGWSVAWYSETRSALIVKGGDHW